MKKFQSTFRKTQRKFTFKEQYEFFESLGKITKTSYNLMDSLELIDSPDKEFVKDIKEDISMGKSVYEALVNTNRFSPASYAVVKVGEETGNLDLAFEKLATYFQIADSSKEKIQKALVYPGVLILAIFALLLYINYGFIPSVTSIYSDSEVQLPLVTKALMDISKFSTRYFFSYILLGVSIVATIGFLVSIYFEKKDVTDVHVPIVSDLAWTYTYSYILWTYYVLISSGVDLLKATDILIGQVKVKAVKEPLQRFHAYIRNGDSIYEGVSKLKLNQKKINYFVNLGEKTGTMEESLEALSQIYLKDLTDKITKISKMIEPALVLVMAMIIGVIVLFVVLPLLSANYTSLQ